jgi:hypothetical protein
LVRSVAIGVAVVSGAPGIVEAQWTVTYLHPPGAEESWISGMRAGQQVGGVWVGNNFRAAVWSGTPASMVELHPTGAFQSSGWSTNGAHQVGDTYIAALGPVTQAVVWSGAPNAWVSLHPIVASYSSARDIDANHQVGIALINSVWHASLWTGTAASWVDLSPAGTTESQARRVDDGQQVGWATVGGKRHASMWEGTAASWVDLHPAESDWYSEASGVHNGRQVGWATVNGPEHAGMWSGTAASWVDLHPAGPIASYARSIFDEYQVGIAVFPGDVWRAAFWNDSAASWEDLSLELTGSWSESVAEDVWTDGQTVYVAGWGRRAATGLQEALLWTRPVIAPPACAGDVNGDGSTNAADFTILAGAFGTMVPAGTAGDLNGDGAVNAADFVILASDFGCVP